MSPPALPPPSLERGRRPPPWAVELLEVFRLRRRVIVAVAALVSLTGLAVTALFPGVLPPRPLSGAAVGLAACFLAVAAGVAVDATDRRIRGPRHVRAAGARLVATTTLEPSESLLRWVDARIRHESGLRLAVAAAGAHALGSGRLTDAVGTALARTGWRVLVADLSHGRGDGPGVAEVCRGERRIGEVAEIHATLQYARLGAGQELAEALQGLPSVTACLPRDVDVLLAALPGLDHPGTLQAAAAADRVLVVSRADVTTRAELVAALDALDGAGVIADVVLLRGDEGPPSAARPRQDREQRRVEQQEPEADAQDREPDGEPERAQDREPDGEPERAADREPDQATRGEQPVDRSQRAEPSQHPLAPQRPEADEPPEPTDRISGPAEHSPSQKRRGDVAADGSPDVAAPDVAPPDVAAPDVAAPDVAAPGVRGDDPTGEIPRLRRSADRVPASAATPEFAHPDTSQDTGPDTSHDATGPPQASTPGVQASSEQTTPDPADASQRPAAEPTSNASDEPQPSLRLAVALDALAQQVRDDDEPRPR